MCERSVKQIPKRTAPALEDYARVWRATCTLHHKGPGDILCAVHAGGRHFCRGTICRKAASAEAARNKTKRTDQTEQQSGVHTREGCGQTAHASGAAASSRTRRGCRGTSAGRPRATRCFRASRRSASPTNARRARGGSRRPRACRGTARTAARCARRR